MLKKIKILTVRQPWAHCIIHRGKWIENRSKKSNYTGELYIQASLKKATKKDILKANFILDKIYKKRIKESDFKYGGIIGSVYMYGCVYNEAMTEWAEKDMFHYIIDDAKEIDFISLKGQLGIFSRVVEIG